ncbi:hypothetical protein HZH66_007305 [Vespula vulgaris]|uniref:Uncharacterized protein n=1 Tax=Vespula vulgaris TaxID=7454 RepID=A0A834JXG6_VESVU|nr:hypothetical protein HZH66_007305 [Vespula vulgaris]
MAGLFTAGVDGFATIYKVSRFATSSFSSPMTCPIKLDVPRGNSVYLRVLGKSNRKGSILIESRSPGDAFDAMLLM